MQCQPNEILICIFSLLGDHDYLNIISCCKHFYNLRDKNREVAIKFPYFHHNFKHIFNAIPWRYCKENTEPVGFVSRINKGTANIYDYVYLSHMLIRTIDFICDIREWDNQYYKRDISIVRSMLQGARISLYLRGINLPEPNFWEYPYDIRDRPVDELTTESYFNSTVIKNRMRNLSKKYAQLELNTDHLFQEREVMYRCFSDDEF